MTTEQQIRQASWVFGALIALTAITVTAATHAPGARLAVIGIALGIAWLKAGLIGYHFMHLKDERPLVWAVLFIAILAVLALAIGVIPDLALRPS
jgi:caa(3)-type oxidase subunit IV